MELVVPDEKLSLAIGRKGQNVRLAAQLTGWKLDIISESKFKQMEEEAITRSPADRRRRPRRSPKRCTASASALSRRSPRRRSRSSRPSRARRRRGGRASIKAQRRARRWSASVRSASAPPRSRPSRSPTASGCCSSAASASARSQLLEEAGYKTRRGHPPRGRGQARDPDRPRHQEGARDQAGRAATSWRASRRCSRRPRGRAARRRAASAKQA